MFPKIILASASPRRREILEQSGIPYTVIPSTIEEITAKTLPDEIVKDLAFQKASDVKQKADPNTVILAADTIVFHQNKILGKPKNREDAFSMLQQLQGNTHQVYTGIAILKKDIRINYAVQTKVNIMPMTNTEIENYIDTDHPMDKAGSYAIQGRFAIFIKEITGDYYNVVGLPISAVYHSLKSL